MTREAILTDIAQRGLTRLYDPETHLFHAKLVQTPEGIVPMGRSFRYSAIAALGLQTAAARGYSESSLPLEPLLARLAEVAPHEDDALDLALVLWAHARADTPEVPALFAQLAGTYAHLHGWYTCMGLSWTLAAVEHVARLDGPIASRAASLAGRLVAELLAYQSPRTGLFCMRPFSWSRKSLPLLIESRIGTFANHSYASYALAQYAQRTRDTHVAECVRRCVQTVCRGQGEQGQWWWMVEVKTGRWVDRYPVYAVHQDGMAIFCLHAAQPFVSLDVAAHLRRGLDWLFGENELHTSLVEDEKGIIWRAIQRTGSLSDGGYGTPRSTLQRRRAVGLGLGWMRGLWPVSPHVEILRECRSYHLGWILYAADALAQLERPPSVRVGVTI